MNAVMLLHIQTNPKHNFTNYPHHQNKELHWIIYTRKNSTNPLIFRWSTKAESTLKILVHTVISLFEASLLIAPIYHSPVAWSAQKQFFWVKLNWEMHPRNAPNVSQTAEGTQRIDPEQSSSEICLRYLYTQIPNGCQFLSSTDLY